MKFLQNIITIILSVVLFVGTACTPLQTQSRFNLGYTAHKKSPVFIEKVLYSNGIYDAPGYLSLDWKEVGQLTILAPPFPPVPKNVFIRWFNYKQQIFYEATVQLPEEASRIFRELPPSEYGSKTLTVGVLPDGQAIVWACNGGRARFSTWIELARAQGRQVEGDADDYADQIEEMRANGEI